MAASTSYTTPKYNMQPSDAQSIQRLIQSITNNIQKITQNVSQMENMNLQIGTVKDSEQLRDKLLQSENYTNQLAKEAFKQLKELNSYAKSLSTGLNTSEEKQVKIQIERLTNQLVKTLNKFQEVQKSTMQKQRESNERAKANMQQHPMMNSGGEESFRLQMKSSGTTNDYDFENANPFDDRDDDASHHHRLHNNQQQQQQQQQISMESDVNLSQLREREAALRKLESDIVDVNMIFKDLAVMVHDQGEIIDSIESNVEQVQIRVNTANEHLESAKKNQQKARKKKFILIAILGSVVAVIILILVLSLQPWR